ncbi:hypothetical protein ACJ72_03446 [Emergomyces africanus]|uniref:DUF4045 domain-containing protein n=1 Tax=Emergomyces africanus TaxID=1955775 RepID=A0A1B7NZL3_9EURO|nr:hypothetical protein ACJ72_03446 [Emergomyces africanus]
MERATEVDGSEDVNEFLVRIRELGNKRDKEDEERARKLEEEIIKGRRERQARRAERARSISPTKDSPGPHDTSFVGSAPHSSPIRAQLIEPPLTLLPSPQKQDFDNTPASGEMGDVDIPKADDLPRNASRLSTPSRPSSRGLAWKQRPGSRDLDAGTSPFPTFPSPKSPFEARSEPTAAPEPDFNLSRSSIAQSLASKDPTWFRQTADRGIGSPAYRRAQDSSVSSDVSMMSGNTMLPGFSREAKVDPEKVVNNDHAGEFSESPSRRSSTYGAGSLSNRYSSVSSVSTVGGLGSPVPLSSTQRIESRASFSANDPQSSDRFAMSPSQNRIAADRPSSPTKGLGGFVQSAMMKRSDSVSKRWSNQPTGRGIVNSKPGYQTPTTLSREASDETSRLPNSRPGSSHSEATVVRQNARGDPEASKSPNDGIVKQSLPSRPLSRADSISNTGDRPSDLPSSPSKTMDSRRWSPTKATWLESALNKPDSPKPKPQFQEEPEWKRGLSNRLRQNKASVDLGSRGSPKLPIQKENELPIVPKGITSQVPKEIYQDPPIDLKPEPPNALGSGNGGLRIDTVTNRAPVPEKSQKLADLKPGPISSPLGRSDSPSASSPVGSLKGLGKPSANLRRRETADGASNNNEPEFKNVFGKLRKTETKNYVAPDLLKDNILKGKAGLNTTGGPKKSDRMDEFKENILKQKEAMKAGGGSIRRPTIGDKGATSPDKPSPDVPEAIARRRNMRRSGSIVTEVLGDGTPLKPVEQPNTVSPSREVKPSAAAGSDIRSSIVHPSTAPPELQATTSKSSLTNKPEDRKSNLAKPSRNLSSENSPSTTEKQGQKFDLPLQQPTTTESHSNRGSAEQASKASGFSSTTGRNSFKAEPDRPRARSGTGKLSERLNPALAGLLSRGPPTSNGPSSGSNNVSQPSMSSQSESFKQSAPAKLTHTTKARAKGPRRRPPQSAKSDPKPQENEDKPSPKAEEATPWSLPDANSNSNEFELDASPTKEDVRSLLRGFPASRKESNAATALFTPGGLSQSKDKPSGSSKSPDLRKFTPTNNKGSRSSNSGDDGSDPQLELLSSKKYVEMDSSPPTPTMRRSTSIASPKSEGKPSPPPKPAAISPPAATSSFHQKNLPPFPPERITSPPVPPKPSSPALNKPKSPSMDARASPFPESSEAVNVFSSFFDARPKASDKVEVDPQSILMSRPDVYPKINTISKQIWEITGDGKRKDLPANQGYILFEQSMYLCVHAFEVGDGPKTTQVHLWCGDEVSEAAVEDAQLFARKVARENSCKLELVKQGKEAPSFIQALGGIIITRRGSGSRSNSSAMYMLCGRRHMGQIAFDEVDLSSTSLCSGLIGMDLGLTGEIEEVIEGKEPPGFFETFPDTFQPTPAQTADHWKLKPTNGKYCCRLYRIDHELGQRFGSGFWSRRGASSPVTRPNSIVQEIEPFCQRDLDPNHIHILDTFFEIFVIVGDRANARSAEFASALIFAQEYSIMAVSLQDRPFLPKSSVVIYGLSDECKRAFRKWEDQKSPRKMPSVFPLNAAIEAIR